MGKKKEGKLQISQIKRTIEINGDIYEVLNPKKYGFKKGFAYVKNGYVFIYKGKKKTGDGFKPGNIYKVNGEYIYIKHTDEMKELYSEDRITTFSDSAIIDAVNNSDNFKEIDMNILEDDGDYFAPPVLSSDDILKIIIKRVLKEKKISLKAAKGTFQHDYDITNMKSNLTKPGPISQKYFLKWVELLGLDITYRIGFIDGTGDYQVIDQKLS